MGWPVVIVDSGGLPVTEVASGYGAPLSIADNGFGTAVTIVESGGLPVVMGGPTPAGDPVTIFTANPSLDADDFNSGLTFRVSCTITDDAIDELRVTISPASSNALTVTNVGVGKRDPGVSGSPNTLAVPVEALFDGASGFSNKTTDQTSGWIDCSALGLVSGDEVVVTFVTGGAGQNGTRYNASATNADTYFVAGEYWDTADVSSLGFTELVGRNYAVASIETRTAASGGGVDVDIPLTFSDAMFVGMTDSTSTTSLADGVDLSNYSIIETSGDPTITCGGNNEITYCRVDSRECIRIQGGDVLISHCYLEATGVGEDHADSIQAYSPGARGGTITIKNTQIRAHTTAATAGYFTADDWGGTIVLQDVIFQGGPWGLIVKSDPGCHINISLKNVYFVGPFGDEGGPFYLQDVGTGTHTVTLWDNVCRATITNGVLVPGAAIANPGSSFLPTDLSAALWLQPDRGGLFQSNAGTTAATANSDVVGYWPDLSGNARHYLSEADNTTRPTLQGVGTKPCLRFDGSNDFLMRTESLGLLAGGSYTLAFAFKSNSPATDSRLFTEGNTASNNTLFIPIQAHNPTASTSSALYRNDAGTQLVSPSSMTNTDVFNDADKVFILTDDGVTIRSYVNGVAGASTNWTPSGVFTLDRSSIGCLLRAAAGNWWAGDIYGMVAIPRVVTDAERASLTTYMGNLAGLSL